MTQKRLPKNMTKAEVDALIGAVNTRSATGLRNRAMLAAMLGAGLRVSEAVALKPNDIDFDGGEVRVNDGKGGRDRVVPVDAETTGWLQAWREKRVALGFNGRQPFFCGVRNSGDALSARAVRYMVTGLAKKAGIEKQIGPHTLRHTYATRMLDEGFTVREVQSLLGHASMLTTEVYLHVSQDGLKAKIQGKRQAKDIQAQLAALEAQIATLKAAL